MGSPPLKPRCRVEIGPPCHRLLDHPEGVLADPDQWPDHLGCPPVAKWSTRRWARARARSIFGDAIPAAVSAWTTTWPLPVSPSTRLAIPIGLLPFSGALGSRHAGLILAPDIPFADVVIFGIVDEHEGTPWPAGLLVTSAGVVDEDGPAERFQRQALKWWQGDNATGRPHGHAISLAELYDKYAAYCDTMGRPPKQAELAAEVDIDPRTLRTMLPQPGGWGAFVAMADALRAHRQHIAMEGGRLMARYGQPEGN